MPPSSSPSPIREPGPRALDALLNAGLQARRDGRLREFIGARHPRLSRWLDERWLGLVQGTLGDSVDASLRRAVAQREWLAWGMAQLRPDRVSGLAQIPNHAWLQSTSWRPFLALACHHGFITIPEFPSHYHRRAGESAVDNLCGLWSVVPSTLYRYMDKGRHRLAEVFAVRDPSGDLLLSLRHSAWQAVAQQPPPPGGWSNWHRQQAEHAVTEGRAADGLWHAAQADDLPLAQRVLTRLAPGLAAGQEADVLLRGWAGRERGSELAFEVALSTATLWRHREDAPRENEQLQMALRLAEAAGSDLLRGRAFAALGRFHMTRDQDRARACYDEGVGHLTKVADHAPEDATRQRAANELARVLVHLAWMDLRRNDPGSLALLERVEQLDQPQRLTDDIRAEIEQTWGEYFRRTGDLAKAMTHKQRALNIYERLGDQRSVLSTCNNLSLIYGEAGDTEQALLHGNRVLAAARRSVVEPEVLAGAHLHIGIAYFYQGRFDQAIEHYAMALRVNERNGIRGQLGNCHFNLAEAYYHRFARSADPEDQRLGEHHAAIALRLGEAEQLKGWAQNVDSLKDIAVAAAAPDRLLPEGFAEHFEEMDTVRQARSRLAARQLSPLEQVQTRLQVARAYLAIATREREAAMSLAAEHGLGRHIDGDLDALRQTFDRALSHEESVRGEWAQAAGDLLDDERRRRVLARLFDHGSLHKSVYAELAGLGLATASKHLGLLATRGLLVQSGRGPATRYRLPDRTAPATG